MTCPEGPRQHQLLNIAGLQAHGANEHDQRRSLARDLFLSIAALNRLHRDGTARESAIQDLPLPIGELIPKRSIPERRPTAACVLRRAVRERVDDLALMPDRKMKMRIFGQSGEADLAERLPDADSISGFHADAALGHVTVLCLPAIRMFDHDTVAALHVFDSIASRFEKDAFRNTIPDARDPSGRSGDHIDTRALRFIDGNRKSVPL